MTITYEFDLIGGPLDGVNNFSWSWLDTPEGRAWAQHAGLSFEKTGCCSGEGFSMVGTLLPDGDDRSLQVVEAEQSGVG